MRARSVLEGIGESQNNEKGGVNKRERNALVDEVLHTVNRERERESVSSEK